MEKKTTLSDPPLPSKEELAPVIERAIFNTNRIDGRGNSNLIVGIVHCATIRPDHITTVYYADGTSMNIEGLLVGRENAKNHFANVMFLKSLIQMIPFVAAHVEGDYLLEIGNEEEMQGYAKDKVSVCYIFRPPAECPVDFSGTKGYEVLENVVNEFALDEFSEVVEGEW